MYPVNKSTDHLKFLRRLTVESGTQQFPRIDKPFTIELSDGSLYVVHMKMVGGNHDHTKSVIVKKRSYDTGNTWVEEETLFETPVNDLNIYTMGLNYTAGVIYLTLLYIHDAKCTTCTIYSSKDDGNTYEEVGKVWENSKGYWLCGYTEILSNNRFIHPFYGQINGGEAWSKGENYIVNCFYSDNSGQTWKQSDNIVYLPLRGAQEPSVVEMDDGRLVMSLRTQLGCVFFSESYDKGKTWNYAHPSNLNASEGITHMKRIPGTNRLLIFWFDAEYKPFHGHYGDRMTIGMAVSDDYGYTWKKIGALAGNEITHFNPPEGQVYTYNHPICTFLKNGDAFVNYLVVTGFGYKTTESDMGGFIMQKTGYIQDRTNYRMSYEAAIINGDFLKNV